MHVHVGEVMDWLLSWNARYESLTASLEAVMDLQRVVELQPLLSTSRVPRYCLWAAKIPPQRSQVSTHCTQPMEQPSGNLP